MNGVAGVKDSLTTGVVIRPHLNETPANRSGTRCQVSVVVGIHGECSRHRGGWSGRSTYSACTLRRFALRGFGICGVSWFTSCRLPSGPSEWLRHTVPVQGSRRSGDDYSVLRRERDNGLSERDDGAQWVDDIGGHTFPLRLVVFVATRFPSWYPLSYPLRIAHRILLRVLMATHVTQSRAKATRTYRAMLVCWQVVGLPPSSPRVHRATHPRFCIQSSGRIRYWHFGQTPLSTCACGCQR